jgi:rsbT co-antagonist protein RsbR
VQQEQELLTFKAVIENASDAISVVAPDGRIVYYNNAHRHQYRCGDTQYGQHIGVIVAEEDQPQLPAILDEIMDQGIWKGRLTHVRADGTKFPALESCFHIKDNADNVQAMCGIVRDITDLVQREQTLRTFQTLVDNSPDGIAISIPDGTITYANRAYGEMTGYGEAIVGMKFYDHYDPEDVASLNAAVEDLQQQGFWQGVLFWQHKDGSKLIVQGAVFLIEEANAQGQFLAAIFRDITEQLHAEQERTALQQRIIETQQATLRELSTPLIPLANGVLAMPLVGTIDSGRAQMVMETLLDGVANHQAEVVILDITGVQIIDTQVANALVQAAQAVRLLGAWIILTGIQPQIAQTLVHLGVDLGTLITQSTLQNGITYALEMRRGMFVR